MTNKLIFVILLLIFAMPLSYNEQVILFFLNGWKVGTQNGIKFSRINF